MNTYTNINTNIDQLVGALRALIEIHSGDVRMAYYSMMFIHGNANATSALNEYEERKWVRTPNGDRWAMISSD